MIEIAIKLFSGIYHIDIGILIRIDHLSSPRNANDYISTRRPVKPFEWRLWRKVNLMVLNRLYIGPFGIAIDLIVKVLISCYNHIRIPFHYLFN